MHSTRLHASYRIVAACLVLQLFSSSFGQEFQPIDIELGTSSQNDPLIELVHNDSTRPDKTTWVSNAIKIEQLSNTKNSKPAGFTFKQSNKGVFLLQVHFEVVQLPIPKGAGNGHGLFIRLVTDANEVLLTIGYGANQRNEKGLCWYAGVNPKPNEIQFLPLAFSRGAWTIQREGSELRVLVSESISTDGSVVSPREIKRIPCTEAGIKEFQILALKQDSGKPSCEYLVKRIRYSGDAYFSQPAPSPPFWTKNLIIALIKYSCAAAFFVFSAWAFYKLAKEREWL